MDNVSLVYDPQHNSRFIRTFHDYFNNQTLADVCFICKDGQKVKAHQMVLGAVSKLLKKLLLEFAGTMQEIVIHLPDVPSSSLKQVLYLLYEGNTHLVGDAEYKEFSSLLHLLGIEPDNSNASSRQEIGGNATHTIPNTSHVEPMMSAQPPASQRHSSINDYHQNMNQLTPSGPSIQTPHGNNNVPAPMSEHSHQEPGGRIFSSLSDQRSTHPPGIDGQNQASRHSSLKRKLADDQNLNPTKSQNIKTEPSIVDVGNPAERPTTHTGQPVQQNRSTSNKNSGISRNGDLRNVRGRGRPRGNSKLSQKTRTSTASHTGAQSSQSSTSDCVVVDD